VLEPGDAISFDSTIPHRLYAVSAQQTEALGRSQPPVSVRFGTIYSFQDPPASLIGHAAVYESALAQIVRSEELGYDWVSLTEHHVTDDGYGPALLPMLAAIAVATSRIGLSTGMLILPLHHPVRIAEEVAVVDILSRGRLALGVAAGYRELEFQALGAPYAQRFRRLEESLEVLVRAWSGRQFSYDGDTLSIPDVMVRPRPLQQPHPPLWIGGIGPRSLRLAAAFDSPLFPGATVRGADLARHFARYTKVRAEAGIARQPRFVLPRLSVVAETRVEASRRAKRPLEELFGRYRRWGGPPHLDEALQNQPLLDDLAIIGDEKQVLKAVRQYKRLGVTDLLLQFALPTLTADLQRESLERFAAAVVRAPVSA
jgi:alkanesulfonate monooxygenase SsuD/methylene tetrahydromethanopterin reductase-like flavin-dependent oxidoreductase (luciferase family)